MLKVGHCKEEEEEEEEAVHCDHEYVFFSKMGSGITLFLCSLTGLLTPSDYQISFSWSVPAYKHTSLDKPFLAGQYKPS